MSDRQPKDYAVPSHEQSDDSVQEEAEAEVVLSGRPVGRRFRDITVMLTRDDLDHLLDARAAEEPASPPTTLDEFRDVLKTVDQIGWCWTTDDPPALTPKESTNQDPGVLRDLSKKHPRFPFELAAVVKYALWGFPPDPEVVGDLTDLDAKVAVVSEMLLTNDYRSEFFFEHATRLKRFHDLDWEVMVKAAERNIRRLPGTVYATITLETSETQPDFDERKDAVLFAADARALKRMIGLLGDALKALEEAKSMAHVMRHETGGHDGK